MIKQRPHFPVKLRLFVFAVTISTFSFAQLTGAQANPPLSGARVTSPPSSSTATTSGGTVGEMLHTSIEIENFTMAVSGGNIDGTVQASVQGQDALAGANEAFYPASCGTLNPPSWCHPPICSSGSPPFWCNREDLGAWIDAAVYALPAGRVSNANFSTLGYKIGTIQLSNANGSISSPTPDTNIATQVQIGPGVNLIGQGKFATVITCTLGTDCIVVDHGSTTLTSQFHHSVLSNSKIENFTIQGTGTAGQNLILFKDVQGLQVNGIFADGAKGANEACFVFGNFNWWTERNTFVDVSTGYNCNIGWRFTAPPEHVSFGYNRFLDIKANTAGAQTAVSIEGSSYLYSGVYRITVNKGGAGSKIWHMQDGASFYENELQLMGEENGSGGYFLDITSPKNQFTYWGNVIWGGGTANHIVPGATLIHWLDSNYFTAAGNFAQNSITWASASTLPNGYNLDSAKACGNYEVTNPVNGPTLSPSYALLHLQVICGGVSGSGYVEQIAYQVNYTNTVPLVFQRNEDGGAWGSWFRIFDGTAGSVGHATCWRAIGQIGYCSTPVGTDGTCTCN